MNTAEVFITDSFLGERWYGWQCFACHAEVTGLNSLQEARNGADSHICQQRDPS